GAYVYIGLGRDIGLMGRFSNEKIYAVSYICNSGLQKGSLLIRFEEKSLKNIIGDYPVMSYTEKGEEDATEFLDFREKMYRTILNCLIWTENYKDGKAFMVLPMERPHPKKLR